MKLMNIFKKDKEEPVIQKPMDERTMSDIPVRILERADTESKGLYAKLKEE